MFLCYVFIWPDIHNTIFLNRLKQNRMARITSHDRRDIDRAAEKAGKGVDYIGTNRTKIDGTVRYGRGDALKYINSGD